MIWKWTALTGVITVLFICASISVALLEYGYGSEIFVDMSNRADDQRINDLSPNIAAEFFAFWFALLATIVTTFVTYKVTSTQDVRKVRQTYTLQILGAFIEALAQIARLLRAANESLPASSVMPKSGFTDNLDNRDARYLNEQETTPVSELIENQTSQLNFSNFRTVVQQAVATEGHFGRSKSRLQELRNIFSLIPLEEHRNLFFRNFIPNEDKHKAARGKLGLHRIQSGDDIVDSLTKIRSLIFQLLKPVVHNANILMTEADEILNAIEEDRRALLEFIHTSEAEYAYGQRSNRSITKLDNTAK